MKFTLASTLLTLASAKYVAAYSCVFLFFVSLLTQQLFLTIFNSQKLAPIHTFIDRIQGVPPHFRRLV